MNHYSVFYSIFLFHPTKLTLDWSFWRPSYVKIFPLNFAKWKLLMKNSLFFSFFHIFLWKWQSLVEIFPEWKIQIICFHTVSAKKAYNNWKMSSKCLLQAWNTTTGSGFSVIRQVSKNASSFLFLWSKPFLLCIMSKMIEQGRRKNTNLYHMVLVFI